MISYYYEYGCDRRYGARADLNSCCNPQAIELETGQKLRWQKVGDNECRVFHDLTEDRPGPVAMSGYHSGRQGWQEACMFLGSSSNWLRRDGN